MNVSTPNLQRTVEPGDDSAASRWLVLLAPFAFLFFLAYWGGLPSADRLPAFIIGAAILCGLTVVLIALLGAIYTVPSGEAKSNAAVVPRQLVFAPRVQAVIGIVMIGAIWLEVAAGIWDEMWHRRYGIPFGKDFFWMPHILLYISIGTALVCGLVAWVAVWRAPGSGSFLAKLRANPDRSMLGLLGLFLLVALPADPLWHAVYGSDLGAFSLPHVVLLSTLLLGMSVGTRLLVQVRPPHYLVRAFVMLPAYMILGVTLFADWTSGVAAKVPVIAARPVWLPVMFACVLIGAMGGMTFTSTRGRLWTAFALLGTAMLLRIGILVGFGFAIRVPEYALMAIMLLTVSQALKARSGAARLAIWVVGAAVGCAVIPTLFNLPALDTLGWVIGVSLSAVSGWIALELGMRAGLFFIQGVDVESVDNVAFRIQPLAVAIGAALAIALVILIAVTPPPV